MRCLPVILLCCLVFRLDAAVAAEPVAFQSGAADQLEDAVKPDPFVVALEARYAKLASWTCSFAQKSHVDVLDQDVTRNGRIAVVRPDKMRIDYDGDPRKIYVVNDKKLWVIQPDAGIADEFGDPGQMISREALSFLGGLDDLTVLFDAIPGLPQAKEFFTIQDAALKRISLVPKDATSPILRITLGVDEKTLTVKEAVLYNASGNVTHYDFTDIVFDATVSEDAFQAPKGKAEKE